MSATAERNYAHEEHLAWVDAMHAFADELSRTRGYDVNAIPRDRFERVEGLLRQWAVAYWRAQSDDRQRAS